MTYTLKQLINADQFQRMADKFNKITGAVIAIVDLQGEILVASGWQDICTKFHRIHPETNQRCIDSDTMLARQLQKGHKYNVYQCKNGLIDIAFPIVIEDMHVGNMFTGQFVTSKADVDFFRNQAAEFGFDQKEYMDALEKVPVFSEDAIKEIMEVFLEFAEMIVDTGYSRMKLLEINQELEEQKETIKAISDNSFDIIHLLSAEGIILDESKAVERILGYPPGARIGKNAFDFVHPMDCKQTLKKFYELLEDDHGRTVAVFRFQHHDGHWVWIETCAQNLLSEDKIKAILVNSRDITLQKEKEQELLFAKDLAEKASRAKSDFLSNMSHEIRTPMNAITGFIDILLEMEEQKEKKEYLEIIKESSEQLLSLINDILSLSKIEAGKMEVTTKRVNMFEKIHSVSNVFKKKASEKGLNFILDIDQSFDKDVLVDEQALLIIVNNLLSNAIKFTEEGMVKLSVKEKEAGKLIIEIQDTGIGINKYKLTHLFEPFEQGQNHLTKQYDGSGLGLAITKRIVDLLDGTIAVETEAGKGTKITVDVPYEFAANNESYKETTDNARIVSDEIVKIISAEDIEINQILLQKMLASEKVLFKKVSNGQELLDELDLEDYDLILMDIQMPVLNGIDATRAVRNHPLHKDIPIIAVSGFAFEENIEEMKAAGVNDFIAKPVRKEALIGAINKVIILHSEALALYV